MLVMLVVLGAGCAALRDSDLARERSEARADDAVCVGAHAAFPSDGYTTCRRRIAEQRQQKEWMELTLAQQQTRAHTPDFLPVAPPGAYLPIDPARYACVERGIGAERWISCAER